MSISGSPQMTRQTKHYKSISVNDQMDALMTPPEEAFLNKVSGLLDNILERVKSTEEKLSLAEQDKIDKSMSSIRKNESGQTSSKNVKNPFKIPDVSSINSDPVSIPINTPKRKMKRRPIKQPSIAEIMDALSLLQMEINDLKENQDAMEEEIEQIHRLID